MGSGGVEAPIAAAKDSTLAEEAFSISVTGLEASTLVPSQRV